jgi:hypothetical protein
MAKRAREVWVPSEMQHQCCADVASHFGYTGNDIKGQSRLPALVRARFAAVWVIKQRWPRLSYAQIGTIVGERDHSTICHAARRAEQERDRSPCYRRSLDALASGATILRLAPVVVPPDYPMRIGPLRPIRHVKPKNALSPDDVDAFMRAAGTDLLLAALRREHPERCAA